ncbi:hypothetical protein [Crocosphaera sp. Alani8]|uniref:hypothetical protein n=1 Tax=Crocosphaera sp. Alani8 TaxID=3038952 RepID=UPI00313C91F0
MNLRKSQVNNHQALVELLEDGNFWEELDYYYDGSPLTDFLDAKQHQFLANHKH